MADAQKTKKTPKKKVKKRPRILQVGSEDLTGQVDQTKVDWIHTTIDDLPDAKAVLKFVNVIFTDEILDNDTAANQVAKWPAYGVIYNGQPQNKMAEVLKERRAFYFENEKTVQEIANRINLDLYRGQRGFAIRNGERNFNPVENFEGYIERNGQYSTIFEHNFGPEFVQIAYYRRWLGDIGVLGQNLIWVEGKSDPTADMEIHFDFFNSDEFINTTVIPQSKFRELSTVDAPEGASEYQVSLWAKGVGRVEINNIHSRGSRHGLGYLLPGGEWQMAENGDEVLSWFNPMDREGPLVVWFSGSRLVVDGFEMMGPLSMFNVPHLLFTDSRVEGGVWDIGAPEYEAKVKKRIQEALDELGYTNRQLIIGGYSMGSYPALYYAGEFEPAAVFSLKPLINLGTMTEDPILGAEIKWNIEARKFLTGRWDKSDTKMLNDKLWNEMSKADWSKIRTYIYSLMDDEYDGRSLPELLAWLKERNAPVLHDFMPGRHGEHTNEMIGFIDDNIRALRAEFVKNNKKFII